MKRAITCAALTLSLATAAAAAGAPKLVRSEPADGATDVATDIGIIRFYFDQNMDQEGWTFWRSDKGEFPPMEGENDAPWRDPRCCELRIGKLAPGTTYAVQLNNAGRKRTGFKSAGGAPLPDTAIAFKTAAAAKPEEKAPEEKKPEVPLTPTPPGEAPVFAFGESRADPERAWSVIIYLAGDGDLEAEIIEAIDDMESGTLGEGVEAIVLIDRAKGYDASDENWTDARAYRLVKGKEGSETELEILSRPGEINLGDPRTLEAFASAAIRTFPAKNYALIIKGHGSGWSGLCWDFDAPGVEGGCDHLTLADLRAALESIRKAAGDRPLDFLMLDASLTGQIEVAADLRSLAGVLVASAALVPPKEPPYDRVMPLFAKDKTGKAVAEELVGPIVAESYAAWAAIDLDALGPALGAMKAFVEKVRASMPAYAPTLSRALFYAQSYGGANDDRLGKSAAASIDLIDFLDRLRASKEASPASAEGTALEEAAKRCIISERTGSSFPHSHALAIYAPVFRDNLRPEYETTAFARETGWLDLLKGLHEAQVAAQKAPEIQEIHLVGPSVEKVEAAQVFRDDMAEFSVSGDAVLQVSAIQARRIEKPAGLALLRALGMGDGGLSERLKKAPDNLRDAVMPEFAGGANGLGVEVGDLAYRVTDGAQSLDVTADHTGLNDLDHIRVPATFDDPKFGKLRADIYFDATSSIVDEIIARVPAPDGRVLWRRIKPEPSTMVTFLFEVLADDGREATAETGTLRWGSGLELFPAMPLAGPSALIVEARSIAGASSRKAFAHDLREDPLIKKWSAAGSPFDVKDMVGSWALESGEREPGSDDVKFSPTKTTVAIRCEGDLADKGTAEFKREGEESEEVDIIIQRGLPMPLLVLSPRASDDLLHFAFKLVEDGKTMFVMRLATSERLTRFVPAEAEKVVVKKKPPKKEAAKKPETKKAVRPPDLSGTWRSTVGWTLVLTGNQFASYLNGILADQGTYQVAGNRITSRSAVTGLISFLSFALEGDTLTLTDALGNSTMFTRKGAEEKEPEPEEEEEEE